MRVDSTQEQICLYAKQLRLPTFAHYAELVRRMEAGARFDEMLLELMRAESAQRQENQNRRRRKSAGFPFAKTLEELDLSRYGKNLSAVFVNELASCQFIDERKNLILIGNPGRGKTHMAIGLGLKACALGMSVLFRNAAALSTELAEARDHYVLGKLEKRLGQADLLILDELSYVHFDRYQSELLFKIVSDRSERGSVIVTTNLAFSQWPELFENQTLVAALVDRLTYHSYVLDMNGDSYRLDQALQEK